MLFPKEHKKNSEPHVLSIHRIGWSLGGLTGRSWLPDAPYYHPTHFPHWHLYTSLLLYLFTTIPLYFYTSLLNYPIHSVRPSTYSATVLHPFMTHYFYTSLPLYFFTSLPIYLFTYIPLYLYTSSFTFNHPTYLPHCKHYLFAHTIFIFNHSTSFHTATHPYYQPPA